MMKRILNYNFKLILAPSTLPRYNSIQTKFKSIKYPQHLINSNSAPCFIEKVTPPSVIIKEDYSKTNNKFNDIRKIYNQSPKDYNRLTALINEESITNAFSLLEKDRSKAAESIYSVLKDIIMENNMNPDQWFLDKSFISTDIKVKFEDSRQYGSAIDNVTLDCLHYFIQLKYRDNT